MNLIQFICECDNNPNIDYSLINGFISVKFFSCWARFPETRTDKMQDFLNHVKFYNP